MYAALSAGTAAFMEAGLFIGISGYVSAFVSQYHGAGQNYKIGVSVWQSGRSPGRIGGFGSRIFPAIDGRGGFQPDQYFVDVFLDRAEKDLDCGGCQSGRHRGQYLSVSDGETTYDDIRAKVDTNIFQSGLFATYKAPSNGLGAAFGLAYARMDNDSSRRFIGDLYEASFDQSIFGLGLEVNYELNLWENGRLIPFAGLRYQHLKQDSLQESTATGLMPLNVRSTNGDTFTSSLGLTLEHNFSLKTAALLRPA